MAKLLSYYNLCPTNVGTEFLGLSPDVENGAVINTLGRNMVIIVKLSNQKQLKSWTVLDRLTAKVVYDFKTKNYVGVFMNRYIREWDENCVDVNKIKKQKFNRNIHDIFSMEHLNTTIVLYENGNTEALDLGLLRRKNKDEDDAVIVEKGHLIKKVNFFEMDTGTMITYFVENISDKSVELVYFMLERDTYHPQGSIYRIKLTRESGVDLSGYIVLNGASHPSLITVWTDKRIFMQQLQDTFDRPNASSIGQFIALLSNLNLKQPISIIGISDDYFALYGAKNGQDGALLMIYNLKFRIVQAQQFFKVYFVNSNLWIIGNNLFLAVGQMLSVVPFRISKEQLSDIIGTQQNKDFSQQVDKEYINEEFELEESLAFDSGLQAKFDLANYEGDNGNEILQKRDDLQSIDYFTSLEMVEHTMKSILNFDILFDIVRQDSNPNDTVVTKLFTNPNGILIMTENFETLANEMEKMGFNEIEITKKLIPVLIEADAQEDLVVALKRYTNISEKELVTALKYAINPLMRMNTPVDFTTENLESFKLLNTVLSCTYNNESILPFLRNEFNLDETIFLLKYLKEFLLSETAELEENPQNILEFNAENIVVQWISIIIDSQYQEILLSKDDALSDLIQGILNVINQCISTTNYVKDFAPILEHFIENKNLSPVKQYSKWYSIENVRLY